MSRAPHAAFALLLVLVVSLQFGPAIGLAGFLVTGSPRWALAGAARDAIVALLVLLAAGATWRARWPASVRWAIAIVAACAVLAALSPASPLVAALNLRRMVLMPLLFIAVRLLPWTPGQLRVAGRAVVATSVVVALAGLGERFAPDALWVQALRLEDFNAANPFDRFGQLPFDVGGRYYSGDLEPWLGRPLRRMVSTFLEPTTLAAAMAAALAAALARRARGEGGGAMALLFAACGLLTVSKGFALYLLLLLGWRLVGLPSPRHVGLVTVAAVAVALALAAAGRSDGVFVHAGGLASGARYLLDGHPFGEGLGIAGNYADTDDDTGGESGFGNAMVQVGLVALLPLVWVRALAREVLAAARARRDPGGPWLASWLLFWLTSYLLSASSLGVGGNALGFVLLALYLHPAWRPARAAR